MKANLTFLAPMDGDCSDVKHGAGLDIVWGCMSAHGVGNLKYILVRQIQNFSYNKRMAPNT